MANELIAKMKKGDKNAIISGLSHNGAIYRMNAISFSALHNIQDADVKKKITELTDDDISLDTYSVSDFAYAALDVMGIALYKGNSDSVKRLIESKFEFLK